MQRTNFNDEKTFENYNNEITQLFLPSKNKHIIYIEEPL